MPTIHLQIYEGHQEKATLDTEGEVECGRQDPKKGDPEPFELVDEGGGRARLVVVPARETNYSRRWFAVCCDEQGQVKVRNLHSEHELKLEDGRRIDAGGSETFDSAVTIDLGKSRLLRVSADPAEGLPLGPGNYRQLDSLPLVPGNVEDVDATMTLGQFAGPDGKAVVDLLKIALKVVQQASGSDSFFQAAAQAITAIVGLDRAAIFLRGHAPPEKLSLDAAQESSPWSTAAEFVAEKVDERSKPAVSRTILEKVTADRRTQIHDPRNRSFNSAHSVNNVHSIVASPVLDPNGAVIAILYGDRWTGHSAGGNKCISVLEGTLVEVLAGAVAGGIARQEEERQRNNLAGFFSPRVAGLLATRPELLLGRDAMVTVLFCDVRGFSTVTEQLGPQKTIEWIRDVLSDLSRCVVDRDGVLVDYVGDELMAMWGAPDEQFDHAERAVNAAAAMLEAIEVLRERWSSRLPQLFGAGIGINTGTARVGNVGSDIKFKYGVLGNTVNGGSRLQAATKQLGVNCLASAQTIEEASARQSARRLAQLQVVGIDQPIHVFEVVGQPDASWRQLREDYEAALADYEAKRFGEATRKLGSLIQVFPDDRPSRMLLTKAVTQIDQPDRDFAPVWVLTRK